MGIGEMGARDDGKASQISCSVCLDPITDNGERSWAKLQCGHQFHLDCIGSAFNFKGVMQCPNCRKIEKGQWLLAATSRSHPDVNMDDWVYDDDFFDLNYSEMAFGVHWCPFSRLTRLPSSFDEGDYSTAAYHDLVRQHAMFEPLAASSTSHHCPYVAFVGPIHPSSSSSGGSVQDSVPSYHNHWNGASAPSEVSASYGYPGMEVHYHSWEHQSSPFSSSSSRRGGGGGGVDQPSIQSMNHRQGRHIPNLSSWGEFMQYLPGGRSSADRTGSSAAPSRFAPHPGSVARTRDRVQALQAYFQPSSNSPPVQTPTTSGSRRSSTHRGYSQAGPTASSSDQTEGFYYFPSTSSSGRNALETESQLQSNRFHSRERDYQNFFSFPQTSRDSIWGPLHQWRLGSDRTRSQNR